MKRINPKTGTTYKRGDRNSDGTVFLQYVTKQIDKDGFFKLKWGREADIKKSNALSSQWQKNNREIHNQRNRAQRYASPRQRAVGMLTGAKNRAFKKGMEYNLTKLWLITKLEKGMCELSGIPFDFSKRHATNFNPLSPSIDRIDSKKGYTMDNCRVILTSLNVALSEYGLEFYLKVAKKVISLQKKKL